MSDGEPRTLDTTAFFELHSSHCCSHVKHSLKEATLSAYCNRLCSFSTSIFSVYTCVMLCLCSLRVCECIRPSLIALRRTGCSWAA